ncbi:hypothetical protein B4N89_41565 [Embleya scabrispora]|uniref:Uncharacterized protein n=1 Tax=Embleya scabrispora TaxID=159449 RepID=A0A1T3NK98_9ACTN|nr:hypothetical protein [Embleya scabrispora]OPC77061.1 hypothetical protein B4N89_41565 [Embleya scabrispora]
MDELRTDVLFAADPQRDATYDPDDRDAPSAGDPTYPVRIMDPRPWVMTRYTADAQRFTWRPAEPGAGGEDREVVGIPCLYWGSYAIDNPTPGADTLLLAQPWEPLPTDEQAAAEEFTRRYREIQALPIGTPLPRNYLLLMPLARELILCPWQDLARYRATHDTTAEARARARDRHWDRIQRRIIALRRSGVEPDAIDALLDRARPAG